ncbi:carbohydrate-binding module 1 [Podospora pseudocomata]|uniref:(4-O-methyl)-D-glucuronate--lignin esterase n=1 Tax=Podospora pseudocomata TaxID=2093779 RepID=A0ABR0GPE3_9PEZI|nr:carbohydrate-binding module 1 [Podospora pseudocomata]
MMALGLATREHYPIGESISTDKEKGKSITLSELLSFTMVSQTVVSSLLVVLGAAGVRAQQRQSLWGQCGGSGWSGPTLCVDGAWCNPQNQWYHQCIPGSGPTTAQPQVPTTTARPTTTLITSVVSTTSPSGPVVTNPPVNPGTCPNTPSGLGTPVANQLNDPFTFHNGNKVTSKADWACRQREISELLQRYELGTLPPKPSSVTASFSGSTLSISVSEGGKSISFTVSINNRPSGAGPHPAIINFGTFGASLPVPAGVATINFNNDDIAQQQGGSSRGRGKFYDLYGSSHSAGALTAWAWGVSRIVDALELTQAQTGIDPTRLGVTGCSRNGKGAIVAGALEPRIALTLPQESGAGGSGCWRIATWQKNNGQNVQDSTQIVQENVWFSPNFNSYVNNVNQLPFDHHLLAGLIAPRALYVMENVDMEWLGKISTYGCMGIARKQWEALGVLDNFGYSQVGGNSHCSFPSSQQGSELNAFIDKFLLKRSGGNTNIFRSTQTHSSFNLNNWSPWAVPSLH